MALSSITEEEKIRIRHHLGYMNMSGTYTYMGGAPAVVPANFLVEGAMDRILEPALGLVRTLLSRLDQLEQQMFDDAENMAVTRIGDIEINPRENAQLIELYDRTVGQLANALGVEKNPYSKVSGGANAINGKLGCG